MTGARRAISEADWSRRLEQVEPLHQWGSVFLVDEGGAVEAWVRDVTGAARHTVVRYEGAEAERIRAGVAAVEEASDRAADLVTRSQAQDSVPLTEHSRQHEASQRFVTLAEELYREILDGA